MSKEHRILMVEDTAFDTELIERELRKARFPFSSKCVQTKDAFLEALTEFEPDIILSDYGLPQFNGLEAFRLLRERRLDTPFILVTGSLTEEVAIECMKEGIDDYILKTNLQRLPSAMVNALVKRDVGRRKEEAERALRASEERYRSLVVATSQIVWATDPEGQVDDIPDWRETTGQSREEVKGRGWLDAVHPNDRERTLRVWSEAVAKKSSYETEYRLRMRDGEYRHFAARGVPVIKENGQIREWVGTCTDITERKRAEKERARLLEREHAARIEAEAANRTKDEFLHTLSHELRTPMTAILGWAYLLRTGHLKQEEVERGLEVIERNAKAQTKLIDELLDVSAIITGVLHLDACPVRLAPLVETAVDSLRPAMRDKAIQLTTDLDPQVGPISGDPVRLQQVAWNLLSNAIKFTPKGGLVEILLDRHDGYARLTISDNGEGIEQEFLPHVFDRFRQADGTITRAHGGLGLGLAIVQHLVEMHGGFVTASSKGKGQGATFTVCLPLATTLAATSRSEDSRRPGTGQPWFGNSPPLDGLRVLLVEDESDTREFLTFAFTQQGAEVRACATASEALQALEQSRPNVLVSDIGLPDEDGYVLINKVRALPAERGGDIPAVALTAYARDDDRRRALAAGYQMHIPKPIQPRDLTAALATLVERKRHEGN